MRVPWVWVMAVNPPPDSSPDRTLEYQVSTPPPQFEHTMAKQTAPRAQKTAVQKGHWAAGFGPQTESVERLGRRTQREKCGPVGCPNPGHHKNPSTREKSRVARPSISHLVD
jgi:hypothetical protein